jgi:hypothetical protein
MLRFLSLSPPYYVQMVFGAANLLLFFMCLTCVIVFTTS